MRPKPSSALLLICLFVCAWACAADVAIDFTEHLGHNWSAQLVHRTVHGKRQGEIRAGECALFDAGKEIPMQMDKLQSYPDGSIKEMDVWLRTELAAKQTKTFALRTTQAPTVTTTDLYLKEEQQFIEIGNSLTAVRIPTSGKAASGPILGIKLANGEWVGTSNLRREDTFSFPETPALIQDLPTSPAGDLQGCTTEILAQGPLFCRCRVNYQFAGGGTYSITFTVRSLDPVIHLDEAYRRAGALQIDLKGFKPLQAWYKSNRMHNGQAIDLDYQAPKQFALLLGWDGYFSNVAPAYALSGAADNQFLGLVSTAADWLPFPYNQALHLSTTKDGLALRASLQDGQRHWGIYVGTADIFKDTATDFYRWWWNHLCVNMDKVLNWQLVWPGMENLEFPHTFFDKAALPTLRQRLQGNDIVKTFMSQPKYKEPRNFTDAATALLYREDAKLYPLLQHPGQRAIDGWPQAFLEEAGFYDNQRLNKMQISDELLIRTIGLELLLGSTVLTAAEKKDLLTNLAFLQHVLNDSTYWPPLHPFTPSSQAHYPGYVCGTPNQKICYLTARGIVAALLRNHPQFPRWAARAMDDFDRIASVSVAPSGAHLESPFYSSRDTIRFGPFWTAMKRAGVVNDNAKAQEWETRLKRCYEYMGHMLTIPDPRLGGRRAYHAIGRSSPGVVDPTIMISAMPFGEDDEAFLSRQRWCWEAQGKPSPDCMGNTGGRDMSLTLLAFLPLAKAQASEATPLRSIYYRGMGLIGRSQMGTDFESNVLFRQDPFCWDLYEANNGAVYLWGKGAPLSIRFGGYWNHGPSLMSLPFGNRLFFENDKAPEWTSGIGAMVDTCLLPELADYGVSVTRDQDWRRDLLFVKDMDREDPLFLLVRDDTARAQTRSAIHWWIMSKDVQPQGYETVGVVPPQGYTDEAWLENLGRNWKEAPRLQGPQHRFSTHFPVDLDLFIATPADPKIVTDAVGIKPGQPYCVNPKLCEYQQLIRIEQEAGKHYLTLLSPRWRDEKPRVYTTIADGFGVGIDTAMQTNRLFLAPQPITYSDAVVTFSGTAGFARSGPQRALRLMVVDGSIAAQGFKLSANHGKAGLIFDETYVRILSSRQSDVEFSVPDDYRAMPIRVIHCE